MRSSHIECLKRIKYDLVHRLIVCRWRVRLDGCGTIRLPRWDNVIDGNVWDHVVCGLADEEGQRGKNSGFARWLQADPDTSEGRNAKAFNIERLL